MQPEKGQVGPQILKMGPIMLNLFIITCMQCALGLKIWTILEAGENNKFWAHKKFESLLILDASPKLRTVITTETHTDIYTIV